MAYVDFAALKERVPIADAVGRLGLSLFQRHDQLRGPCPACKSGGDRALVVTPAKQAFYCFGGRTGGDVIALVAHIRGTDMKEAADYLQSQTGAPDDRREDKVSPEERVRGDNQDARVLKPLTYLERDHERIRALGLDADTCTEFGAGYAPKGILRGRVAIPIHDWRSGNLVAYCGHTVRSETPKLVFPKDFDPACHLFIGHKAGEGETILMRDPLEIMLAHQNGIVGGISFLTESASPAQLQMLAAIMEEKGIAALDIA
jgi:hypothetical protein